MVGCLHNVIYVDGLVGKAKGVGLKNKSGLVVGQPAALDVVGVVGQLDLYPMIDPAGAFGGFFLLQDIQQRCRPAGSFRVAPQGLFCLGGNVPGLSGQECAGDPALRAVVPHGAFRHLPAGSGLCDRAIGHRVHLLVGSIPQYRQKVYPVGSFSALVFAGGGNFWFCGGRPVHLFRQDNFLCQGWGTKNKKPPRSVSEDTLLSAMETAGADEMPDEVERKGLGTPATRAGIIEKLVQKGFLERKGDKKTKHLIPTHKGTALVTVMPEQVQSPSMTADWEEKLLLIEQGEYSSEDFMEEIKGMIAGLVQNYEVIRDSEVLMAKEKNSIGTCPLCGSAVEDKAKAFFCSNRNCKFALWKNNRYFESIGKNMNASTAQKLLTAGKVKLKGCKSKKTGKSFDAIVYMEVSDDGKTNFSMEFENGGKRK